MKDRIVIGTTEKKIKEGGIPSFISELKKHPDYRNSDFAEIDEGTSCTSLGTYDNNRWVRLIKSQFKALLLCNKYQKCEIHSLRTGVLAALLFRKKTTFFCHGPGFQEGSIEGNKPLTVVIKFVIEIITFNSVATIKTASEAFRKKVVESYCIKESKVSVQRPTMCFDKNKYFAKLKKKYDDDKDLKVVICRRLVHRTGVLEFVELINQTKTSSPAKIRILGTGVLESAIREKARNNTNITIEGFVDENEKVRIYNESHLMVIPTKYLEGLGMIVLEALEHGCLPVACNVDGMGELLRELEVGVLVDNISELPGHVGFETIKQELLKMRLLS